MKLNLDESTGDLFTPDGEYLGSLGEILPKKSDSIEPADNDYDPDDSDEDDDYDDDSLKNFKPSAGLSETLIKRTTNFGLPEEKAKIEKGLWVMFSGGIHQAMTNTSTLKKEKRSKELMHAAIISSLVDRDIAKQMTISDYIQLHLWSENLIARSVTFEGDGLRDATLIGRNLNPGVVDALRYTPEQKKSGGGFFGFLKR